MTGLQPAGLPHSEIWGSKIICIYPQLIAAYHVLHRLREPRHPPSALSYFLITDTLFSVGLIYLKFALFCFYFTLFEVVQYVKDLFLWRITDSNR